VTGGDPAAAVGRARDAQPAWAAEALADRVAVVRRFRDAVEAEADELAVALTADMGKPVTQARGELAGTLGRLDFFLDEVEAAVAPVEVHRDADLVERISFEPLGTLAHVSAWNYPWFVGTNVFVPALLTGNAVVHKPSELVPRTGDAMARLLHAAGVPDDVFVLVAGDGPVGAELVRQRVDGVFFTGSYATGRAIAEATSGRMITVQLELGGKDPVYVRPDVDLDAAARSLAEGAFSNAGQSCCAVERIYVHEAVHDDFVARFAAATGAFVPGDPTHADTTLGPLTRPQQADVLEAQVADAMAHGAHLVTGGARIDRTGGTWFPPTVLIDVTDEMAVMRDESFGPIIGIRSVASDDEAVSRMNDTEYGLTAGVYTRDEAVATAILARLDAGSAYWNCCDRVSPRLPWSGRHHSGVGTTLSTLGIRSFVRPKAWHLRRPA